MNVLEVTIGGEGVLSGKGIVPSVIVDSTTIDPGTSETLRANASALGTEILAVPVSGNPKVVKSGRLTSVASGPVGAFGMVLPYLDLFGRKVTYVGEQDEARLVKICHNLVLGVVAQSLAEIAVLAEAAGVRRAAFLEFLNDSVMGSTFTKYKTPALVHLDYTPTFTWHLLQKDFDIGLSSARSLNVPLPTAALMHQIIAVGIGRGFGDQDFAALLTRLAQDAGIDMELEDVSVGDGLS